MKRQFIFNVGTTAGCWYESHVVGLCVRSLMSVAVRRWLISEGKSEDVPVEGEVMRAHTKERWRQ